MDKFINDSNIMSGKGEWDESKHPRDSDGKFIEKGTGRINNKSKFQIPQDINITKQINKVLNGTFDKEYVVMSKETPNSLTKLGIPNKPIIITAKHTYLAIKQDGKYKGKNEHYHNLGQEVFTMIPKLLESPFMVLQSKNKKDDIIAILNWYDKDKNVLICPIRINGFGKFNEISISGNVVKSVYGKIGIQNYVSKNFTTSDILSIQNKKIRDL